MPSGGIDNTHRRPLEQAKDESIRMQYFDVMRRECSRWKVSQVLGCDHAGFAMNGSGKHVAIVRVG